jgi:hypothetical protein
MARCSWMQERRNRVRADQRHTRPGDGMNGPARASLPAGALAVLAPKPAARWALAFLQLLPGPPNAAFSGVSCLASSTQP